MAKINLEESFRIPFELLGKVPWILVPLVMISAINLVLTLAMRRILLRWEILVTMLVGFAVTLFGMAWVTLLLRRYFKGEKVALQETWIELSENLGNIAIAVLLVTVIVTLGLLFYIVPGILLATLFLVVIPHTAVEKTTFDKSLVFMSRFVFADKNFLPLLLYIVVAFLLGLIPVVGSFLNAFFLALFFPYLYLQYGKE
ncbi:MAG: hypothetical protein N2Z84_04745 [Atribacterota bacterium]|nr:hypothetical protein [Atribacterota bacterium]